MEVFKMANLQEAVKKFASDLGDKVESFISDVSELEVRTYTTPADQVETFIKGQADFAEILTEGKASLRAYTSVAFDGDTTVWVPIDASGQVDKSMWNLHQVIVEQAMANRTNMIEAVGKAATAALDALSATSGE
jgi:hypothetical protein